MGTLGCEVYPKRAHTRPMGSGNGVFWGLTDCKNMAFCQKKGIFYAQFKGRGNPKLG